MTDEKLEQLLKQALYQPINDKDITVKVKESKMKFRKENQEKLDKIFYHFEENIFNEDEYKEYASRTTNVVVAFSEWIENIIDFSDAVYRAFGSDDDRLVQKVHDIFDRQVKEYFEDMMKPFWDVA